MTKDNDVARTQLAVIMAACQPAGEFDISGRDLVDALERRAVHINELGGAIVKHLYALLHEAGWHADSVDSAGDFSDNVALIADAFSDLEGALVKAADSEYNAREVA